MIPDITELNFPEIDGKQYATLTHAEVRHIDMGEKTITTQVKIDGEITPDFSKDWEVVFQGEKYIMPLRIPQGAKENTSFSATVDLTFQHWAIYQLKRWPFVTIQQIAAWTYLPDEEVSTVQLNLGDFCTLFGQVLEYYYGGAITINLNPAWQYKQEATIITISHTKIWNVLIDALHDKYGVRWEIKAASDNSNTVKGGERYVIRVGYPATAVSHIFEYGFKGGLLKVERQVQSEEIRNMLKGRGGDTNIPFRYFKNTDPNNPDFRPDPDWVEELANIYFPNLMPATFRSYVQGWKAAHISKYPGYAAVGENNAYAPWAYRKGYTDTKFSPVEFVADEITVNPTNGDRQVEILPGYSPYVKKGSSLDKYGPLPDTLDNNDGVYPTLQGTGLDIAVAVEQVKSDDVAASAENDAVISNVGGASTTARNLAVNGSRTVTVRGPGFDVPAGKTANFIDDTKIISATSGGGLRLSADEQAISTRLVGRSVHVYTSAGTEIPASGIPAGVGYYYIINATVHNISPLGKALNITVGTEAPRLQAATLDDGRWRGTFDIWVKNIWDSAKLSDETDAQYSERVWKPILGDREGSKAKVVFTSGALVHEDYEFTIEGYPVPDNTKSYTKDGVTHSSHWRITLAKSDAELEATGLYVPSTMKRGKAGDTFVFTGTEMTHVPYVVDAEIRLDDSKKDQLREKKEIKPTFVVTTDRVRLNNEGRPGALISLLRAGNSIRLADKRFITTVNDSGAVVPSSPETLFLQSVTYTYREPSSDDAALNPDVEIVLGTEYTVTASPVSMIQSDISALQQQVGAVSNIEQILRAVGDKVYLRKDGISDRSMSPTQFFSFITSGDFRLGAVGGAGWGFFKDENGNWTLETDRINVRQEMQVNTLVINQIEGRGGMEIDTGAFIQVTRVVETGLTYVCYFDQKEGTVANLFHIDDVAYCHRWTPENAQLKYYRRRVLGVGPDHIVLTKGYPPQPLPDGTADTGVNGSGVPAEGDNIIHFGNYTDATRQYVKVRDVIGGGYERYIEGLDSVNASGTEYYFIGRQTGAYGNRPRFFIGDAGSYLEYVEGKLRFKGIISSEALIDDTSVDAYIDSTVLKEVAKVQGGNVNILRNSDFRNDFDTYWGVSSLGTASWSIGRPRQAMLGNANNRLEVDLSDGTVDITQEISNIDFRGSRRLTFSVDYGRTSAVGTGDVKLTAALGVILSDVGVPAEFGTLALTAPQTGRRLSATADITIPDDAQVQSVTMYITLSGTGTVYIQSPMLEFGGHNVEWVASPLDNVYLREALKGTTAIAGGLTLTSLIKLGRTDVSGAFNVMSGISGIVDTSARGNGVAIWCGGDQVDAVATGSGARAAMRHDGTGYAAGGVFQLNDDHISIGKDALIRIYGNGLFMYKNGRPVLQMSNTPVSASATQSASPKTPINVSRSQPVTVSTQGYTFVSANPVTISLGSSSIGAGAMVSVDLTVIINTLVGGHPANHAHRYPMPSVRLSLRKQGASSDTSVIASEGMSLLLDNNLTRAIIQRDFTIPSAGLWQVVMTVENSGGSPTYVQSATMQLSGTLTVTTSLDERIMLGNNGMSIVFENCALIARAGYVGARAGKMVLEMDETNGLRVSNNSGAAGSWKTLVAP